MVKIPTTNPRPIAVITCSPTETIDYLRKRLPIREINFAKLRLTTVDGQVYILVLKREDLLGLEISDFIVGPLAHENTHYIEILREAEQRIR